jgi:hypothetical protein
LGIAELRLYLADHRRRIDPQAVCRHVDEVIDIDIQIKPGIDAEAVQLVVIANRYSQPEQTSLQRIAPNPSETG